MSKRLRAINAPDIEHVHALFRDRVTSHGIKISRDATDAPKPNSTSKDGSAQHRRVLTE